jgi:hypothetical protein
MNHPAKLNTCKQTIDPSCKDSLTNLYKKETASDDYTVKVNGKPVFVYRARVSAIPHNFRPDVSGLEDPPRPLEQTEIAAFAYWDTDGPVKVEIASKREINRVDVRPSSYGIHPLAEGNKVTFEMPLPRQITAEINGVHQALHLFANPSETHAFDSSDSKVHYFGPGEHKAGKIVLKDNETVYIAAGAIVRGAIEAVEASNVKILGRGILDCGMFGRHDVDGAIVLKGCSGVEIKGIIVRDSNLYGIVPLASCDIVISNVKLIGFWRYNTDGIDVINSQQVKIENCFIRSFDDSISIKGSTQYRKYHPGYPTKGRPTKNVTVTGCVVWNDWGRALEIGAETCAPEITNIVFKNCDIIHTTDVALDMQHGDQALIKNIRFENIHVELDDDPPYPQSRPHPPGQPHVPRLIVLIILKTQYSEGKERGSLQKMVFKNINVIGKHFPTSTIHGYDADHRIDDVTIENLRINGKLIRNEEEGEFYINNYVKNVKFIAD